MQKCNSVMISLNGDLLFWMVWVDFLDKSAFGEWSSFSEVNCSYSESFFIDSSTLSEFLYKLNTLSDQAT